MNFKDAVEKCRQWEIKESGGEKQDETLQIWTRTSREGVNDTRRGRVFKRELEKKYQSRRIE